MPWKYSKRVPETGTTMDEDSVNEALQPFVEEISALGEHNINDDIAGQWTVSDLDTDVAWRYSYVTPSYQAVLTSAPFSQDSLRDFTGWQPVPGLSKAATFRSARLRILASIQQGQFGLNNDTINYPTKKTTSGLGHIKYAVAIDGGVVPSTITGDVTPGQGRWAEMGRHGDRTAEMMDVLVNIAPGYHTVAIYCFIHRPPVPQAGDCIMGFGEREMFCWELD